MLVQPEFNLTIDMIGTPVMIISVQADGRFTFLGMNLAAEEYYGWMLERRNMDNFEGLQEYQINQRKKMIKHLKQCVATKKTLFLEREYQRPDGGNCWERNTLVPIFDEDCAVQQVMITSVDITELAETQKCLEEALTKTLSGFITICAACKKIRHEDEWQIIEQYASEQMNFHQFSHGMCPACHEEHYGDAV